MAREFPCFRTSTIFMTRSPTCMENIRCISAVELIALRSMNQIFIFWLRLPTSHLTIFYLAIRSSASTFRVYSGASGAPGTATSIFRMITRPIRA